MMLSASRQGVDSEMGAYSAQDLLPAKVLDVELSRPVDDISQHDELGNRYREAWLLARVFDEPIGLVKLAFDDAGSDIRSPTVAEEIRRACGVTIASRVGDANGDVKSALAGRGTGYRTRPSFLALHDRWAADGPDMTVVICTRNRPDDLSRALDSLRDQSYRRFSTLVVDNAPTDDRTSALVLARPSVERVAYCVEQRPGLSRARNRALGLATTPVIAWLDDDEIADRHWLMETAAAYCQHPTATAVSGIVVPAELRTWPQLWFEDFGGHSKGRGFVPDRFTVNGPSDQHPLYPLPPFGVGANMSFAADQLRQVGGFDVALGAGTLTHGGEDTLVFSQILLRGGTVVYQPTSVTRHYHRPDYASLAKQMRGYGVGLTAYYTSLLRSDWRLMGSMLKLAPRAFHDNRRGGGARVVPESFPRELLRLKTIGMLQGPLLYVRARYRARRLESS